MIRHAARWMLSAGVFGLLLGCAAMPAPQLVVTQGNRAMRVAVLLPDGYGDGGRYPMVLAVHNFGGDGLGFGTLIHAERLRQAGMIVVLPEAAGLVGEWQGPGLTLTAPELGQNGSPVDDIAGLVALVEVMQAQYRVAAGGIGLIGFSQGATAALELARRLDAAQPGAVRRLVIAAGSLARPADASLALPGTDVLAYDPGRNGMQDIANFITGQPGSSTFIPQMLAAKGCVLAARTDDGQVDRRTYRCAAGSVFVHLYERRGEHAWPGQDRSFDSRLMGRGSISAIDLTAEAYPAARTRPTKADASANQAAANPKASP